MTAPGSKEDAITSQSEVVVVGGGVTGWAIAYLLVKRGVRVVVVERDTIAAHASGMAAGVLNPLDGENIPGPLQPLALEGYRRHLALWPELAAETGIDVQGRQTLLLRVAFNQEEEDILRGLEAASSGIDPFVTSWVSHAQIARLEPSISDQATAGLLIEGIGSLDSYLYTLALARAAEKLGARYVRDSVVGLARSGEAAASVTLSQGHLPCQIVVLATGPWSCDAEAWLGQAVPVYPLKGDLLRLVAPQPVSDIIIYHRDGLISRKRDGLVWAGSTNEEAGFDDQPSASARDRILSGAVRVVPGLSEARVVRHTSCLRPQTADGLPIVGQVPGWKNVYLATGAGHKGILISPSLGTAVADLVVEGYTSVPIDGLGLERFTQVGR